MSDLRAFLELEIENRLCSGDSTYLREAQEALMEAIRLEDDRDAHWLMLNKASGVMLPGLVRDEVLAYLNGVPMKPICIPWTVENTEELKRLRADGRSFGEIVVLFEGRYSRNACIGKAARIGLCSKGTKERAPRKKAPKSPKRQFHKVETAMEEIAELARVPYVPVEIEPPPARRVSLLELTNATCRFPLGDVGTPGFCFCGNLDADLAADRPYCAAHHKLIYRAPGLRQSASTIQKRKLSMMRHARGA